MSGDVETVRAVFYVLGLVMILIGLPGFIYYSIYYSIEFFKQMRKKR